MVPSAALAGDARSIESLKARAATDPKAAIKEAARQFEALFMQELVKSMRQATQSSGLLDNQGTSLGTELLDTQLAGKLAGLPGGLSDVIARQLERQMGTPADSAADAAAVGTAKIPTVQAAFVQHHRAAAQAAAAESGIPAAFMLGQAAHESGWGRHEIRNGDGSSSHNLFGIKADASWKGAVAEVTTTEVVDGVARKVAGRFRAYASDAESFRDYARLIAGSPRYQQAYAQAVSQAASAASGAQYAAGLQRAGYATDPAYADKLARVINTTLRLQRASGVTS